MCPLADPPQHVQDELTTVLKRRYAKIDRSNESITYDAGNLPKYKYSATVRYSMSMTANFEYRPTNGTQQYHWYCVQDWKD